jgi:alkylhydroperoxidase family enzyme
MATTRAHDDGELRRRQAHRALAEDGLDAIVAASVALTATPNAFGPEHVDRLRRAGVTHAAPFFNWANRLMLSLREPATTV